MEAFDLPLSFKELDIPSPKDNEVIIKVESCGVCHSDLHIINGDLPGFKIATKLPLIPGHEVVGRIVQIGDQVKNLSKGERVGLAWTHSACGHCEQCQSDLENLCRNRTITGLTVNGGYAEYTCANADFVVPIPDTISSSHAAPLLCAGVTVYRALKRANTQAGQQLAVLGIGGLGHMAVQIGKAMGAIVIAIDRSQDKLDLAISLGAQHAFNINDADSLKQIRKLGGAHTAVVTSAQKEAYDFAFKTLKPAGSLVAVGFPVESLSFSALSIAASEIKIIGSAVGTRRDLREVIELAAAGHIQCNIESQPLENINHVFDRMKEGKIPGRVVITF
jgi:propanol-preferring alcohol dehydrogenase